MTEPLDGRVPASPRPLLLEETDLQVAGYIWLERRRFELLGGWAISVGDLEAKSLLAVHARHHAWHASLWTGHRPRRSGHHGGGISPAHGHPLATCLAAMADGNDGAPTIERLVGAYRLLAPYATRAYTDHLARTSVISDSALARTCRLVLADQLEDLAQGEALLQSRLRTDAEVERSQAWRSHLLGRLAGGEERQ